MALPSHDSIEFTIRQKLFCGPVIYVRRSVNGGFPGDWIWGRWRKARDSERNAATLKLMELNK